MALSGPLEAFSEPKKSNFQLPKGPCGHDTRTKSLKKSKSPISSSQKTPAGTTPGRRAWKVQKVKFPAPKRPLRARHPDEGLEKIKKSNFQVPKGPCGHDIRSAGFEKPFKISSRQVKMEKCFFMKKWNLYWKNTIKSNFLMNT